MTIGGVLGLTKLTQSDMASSSTERKSTFPWKPHKLDVDLARDMAYRGYYQGGCCYGAFNGLLGQLAVRNGHPSNSIPIEMMAYGKSGVAGFGTLCGALNGSVVHRESEPLSAAPSQSGRFAEFIVRHGEEEYAHAKKNVGLRSPIRRR